tara:strand:- start:237 stop:947 length:711 start_codon:yes stop_codon:yes gene_type:complete
MDFNSLVIITTSLSNDTISEKRRINLINNFSKYNINIHFLCREKSKDKNHRKINFNSLLERLMICKKLSYDYCLVIDDDFYPIDNFLFELNEVIKIIPNNWIGIHLCAGFLWGRKYKDKTKIGELNTEKTKSIHKLTYDETGKIFINNDPLIYKSMRGWLGGPICFLINNTKENINNLITDYISYEKTQMNNDVILTNMLNKNIYVCRDKQLGYEEECGGRTYHKKIKQLPPFCPS